MDHEVWILYQDLRIIDDGSAIEIADKMVRDTCQFVYLDREHLGVICSKGYLTDARRRKIRERVIPMAAYVFSLKTEQKTERKSSDDASHDDAQNVNPNREVDSKG